MNTNRRTRIVAALVTALLPLSAVPTLAHADAAMDACIKAFVNANLEKERPVKVRRVEMLNSPIYPRSSANTILLTARTKHGRQEIARATCVVEGDEVVLNTEGKPVTTIKVADAARAKE